MHICMRLHSALVISEYNAIFNYYVILTDISLIVVFLSSSASWTYSGATGKSVYMFLRYLCRYAFVCACVFLK